MNENKCPSCLVNLHYWPHEPGCVRGYTLPFRTDKYAGYGRAITNSRRASRGRS